MLKGGVKNVFPWGTEWPQPKDAGNYSGHIWNANAPRSSLPYLDGFPTTAPVMSFKPNKLGIYDLGGNAWEWVTDWLKSQLNDQHRYRTLRGSTWKYPGGGAEIL